MQMLRFQEGYAYCCRIMGQWIRRVALPEDEEFMGFGTNHVPGPFSTGSVQQATGGKFRLYQHNRGLY